MALALGIHFPCALENVPDRSDHSPLRIVELFALIPFQEMKAGLRHLIPGRASSVVTVHLSG